MRRKKRKIFSLIAYPLKSLLTILNTVHQFECCVLSGVVIKKEYALNILSLFVCELFIKTVRIYRHILLYGASSNWLGNFSTQL